MGCSLLRTILDSCGHVCAHTLYMLNVRLDGILQFSFGNNLRGERKLKINLDSVSTNLPVICTEKDYGRRGGCVDLTGFWTHPLIMPQLSDAFSLVCHCFQRLLNSLSCLSGHPFLMFMLILSMSRIDV